MNLPFDLFAALVVMLGIDIAWAKYILAVSDRRALHAALWSGCIAVNGASLTLLYVDSHWTIIPAAVGAVAGTYWTVRRG